MKSRAKFFLLPLIVGAATVASAQAGSPHLTGIYPVGGQRGTVSAVECKGSNVADFSGVLFDQPGFEVLGVLGGLGGLGGPAGAADKSKCKFQLKIPADARPGEHTFRLVTASGISDVRLFYVSPFPMVEETELDPAPRKKVPTSKESTASTGSTQSTASTASTQLVPLGTTVYGHTFGEDQDRFEVEAKKGQRISVEAIGVRLQTAPIYDPAISLARADGSVLAEADDCTFTRQDPVLSIIAPEDGRYVITIKEATNAGVGECHYLLNIGTFPRPLVVYPGGGPTGEPLKVELLGDTAGTITQTVQPAATGMVAVYPAGSQTSPQPNFLRVSPFANVLETEPNNTYAQATVVDKALPLSLNGIISEKADEDCFKIKATKGAIYDVTVFARRLRSPLDSVLSIHDATGKQLAANDDDGQLDSALRWTVAADGDYIVKVTDKLHRGGPLYTYRVELVPVQPRVSISLPEMTQNQNQDRRSIVVPKGNRYASLVRVKRKDFAGELQMAAQELPAGVSFSAPMLDKGADTVPMVFEAGAESVPGAKAFTIAAKAPEPPKQGTLIAGVEQETDVVENGNQRSFYSVREENLALAVSDAIPVKLELVAPKVALLQNGALTLKVRAERSGNFKGAINLALLFTPTGIGTGGTLQIPAGQSEFDFTLSANANATLRKWQVCVVGNADFGSGTVWFSTRLVELEVAAPFVDGKIARSFVDQGDSTTVTVKLENKVPFEGKAKLSLLGLPSNTTATDVEITKDDKEARFTVKAGADAPAASHKQLYCQFQLLKSGETVATSFAQGGILRIDKAHKKP